MAKESKKKGKLRQKLVDKYRLVVLNENTFEERFSLKLSRLNVFVIGSIFSILLIAFTILLIAFSPLREYIPGYSSTQLKIKATKLVYQADSLKNKLAVLENYITALKPVFTGKIENTDSVILDSLREKAIKEVIDPNKLNATKEDSLFREKIESKNRFALYDGNKNKAKIVFFAPVTGSISQQFNSNNKHFAIDIVAKVDSPVKAVADGTVILAEWTAETGYVIAIQHPNQYISVYKHNGTLLKQQGDFVKSGEVIASVGDTGELTTGPHLHFELWNNGYPVNPINYIDFE
ncbi:M23 family metallopeptidase [Tenacibaculum sp. UWU-22]|uniref:M23 family metallopeptidase n=1 Tax=Tenacibaculum sp. UWU-22 TaxID=3234187 RepID=UPI0034DB7987